MTFSENDVLINRNCTFGNALQTMKDSWQQAPLSPDIILLQHYKNTPICSKFQSCDIPSAFLVNMSVARLVFPCYIEHGRCFNSADWNNGLYGIMINKWNAATCTEHKKIKRKQLYNCIRFMCMCVCRTIRAICNRAKDFCWGGGLQSGAKELSSRGVCAGFEERPRPITARGYSHRLYAKCVFWSICLFALKKN